VFGVRCLLRLRGNVIIFIFIMEDVRSSETNRLHGVITQCGKVMVI
jgi:hypothetical protein